MDIDNIHLDPEAPVPHRHRKEWQSKIRGLLDRAIFLAIRPHIFIQELLMANSSSQYNLTRTLLPSVVITVYERKLKKKIKDELKNAAYETLVDWIQKAGLQLLAVHDPIKLQAAMTGNYQVDHSSDVNISIPDDASTWCGLPLRMRPSPVSEWGTACAFGGTITKDGRAYGLTAGHGFFNMMAGAGQYSSEVELGGGQNSFEPNDAGQRCIFANEDEDEDEPQPENRVSLFAPRSPRLEDRIAVPQPSEQDILSQSDTTRRISMRVITPKAEIDGDLLQQQIRASRDWALLEMPADTVAKPNKYYDSGTDREMPISKHPWEADRLHEIREKVTIVTSTTTSIEAKLSSNPSSFGIGRYCFDVWNLFLSDSLGWGNSGSWVVHRGEACGYIIATRQGGRWASMVPISNALDDIKAVTQAGYIAISADNPPQTPDPALDLRFNVGTFDLLERRKERFVLWTPVGQSAPRLILGTFKGTPHPGVVTPLITQDLSQTQRDLWELSPGDIHPPLENGNVYHYWFEVDNTFPGTSGRISVTDPLAYTVDYRQFGAQERNDSMQPPAVIKFRAGKLWPCDIDGKEPEIAPAPVQSEVPSNNYMVIYELPTSWARSGPDGIQVDRGTFTDILALFEENTPGLRFASVSAINKGAILTELGINALELLPIADSKYLDEWGYSTAHYFAPDADLGSAASLIDLIKKICPRTRLIMDTVMAFGRDPYAYIAFNQFHLVQYKPGNHNDPLQQFAEPSNPDSWTSHSQGPRNGFGGSLWRYIQSRQTYDPQAGQVGLVHPSWSFHTAHLQRWLLDFGVSGLRLDSINNIANYDFIKHYKNYAWELHQARGGSVDKFIVIGEELSMQKDLLTSGTLNALWNEPFQSRLRSALLGEGNNDNFEWTVKKMIDCTLDGFADGAQAVNYITSHDVAGYRKERLFNFLKINKVYDIERRAKLAFACLLTAVGIPMILAGEEFCDEMDLDIEHKQSDPVNYERLRDGWRSRVFSYVANLIDLRQNCPALGVNDTSFIHVDNSRGGKILAWVRGTRHPMVVVANFTDDDTPGRQYYVPNWPDRNRDDWREVTQNRKVPADWVGREPLMHWEAKVYTYWQPEGASSI